MSSVFDVMLSPQINGLEEISKSLRKAAQKGLEGIDYSRINRQYKKMGQQFKDLVSKSLEIDVKIDTKNLNKARNDYLTMMQGASKKLASYEEKLRTDSYSRQEKARFQTRIDTIKKELREEENKYNKILKFEKKRLELAGDYLDSVKEARKEMGETVKEFGDGMKNAVDGFMSNLESGDFSSIFSNFGKGSKGLGKKMKGFAASKGPNAGGMTKMVGTMGIMMTKLGVAAGALAGVAGVVAALGAVFTKVQGQAFDFNRSLLEGAGAADLMYGNTRGLTKELELMRKSTTGIGKQMGIGMLAKDQIQVLNAFRAAGMQVNDFGTSWGKVSEGAEQQMKNYQKSVEVASAYSRLIGIGATEMATQMASWSEELGGNLNYIANELGTITRQAAQGGFGVKRFYSTVVQATSGMAGYNIRLSETGALLSQLVKSLGMEQGGSLLQGLSKGFAGEDMNSRRKRIKLTGSAKTKEHANRTAMNVTQDFARKLMTATGGSTAEDRQRNRKRYAKHGSKFGGDDGLNFNAQRAAMGDKDAEKQFMRRIQKMSYDEMLKEKAAMQAVGGRDAEALARSLESTYRATQLAKGGMNNMASNMDAFDMTGKLNMIFDSGRKISGGKELYQIRDANMLQAVSDSTGMSLEEIRQYQQVQGDFAGKFNLLKEGRTGGLSDDEQFAKYGAANIDGQVQTEDGRFINTLDQFVQSQGKQVDDIFAGKVDEDIALGREVAANTFDMSNILSAGIAFGLETLVDSVNGIAKMLLRKFGLGNTDSAENLQEASKAFKEKAMEYNDVKRDLKAMKRRTKDLVEKKKIDDQIKAIDIQQKDNLAYAALATKAAMKEMEGFDTGLYAHGSSSEDKMDNFKTMLGHRLGQYNSGDRHDKIARGAGFLYADFMESDNYKKSFEKDKLGERRDKAEADTKSFYWSLLDEVYAGNLHHDMSTEEKQAVFKKQAEKYNVGHMLHFDGESYQIGRNGRMENIHEASNAIQYEALGQGDAFTDASWKNYLTLGIADRDNRSRDFMALTRDASASAGTAMVHGIYQDEAEKRQGEADAAEATVDDMIKTEDEREKRMKKFQEGKLTDTQAKKISEEIDKAQARRSRKKLGVALGYSGDQLNEFTAAFAQYEKTGKKSYLNKKIDDVSIRQTIKGNKDLLAEDTKDYYGLRPLLNDFLYAEGRVHRINTRDDIAMLGAKADGAFARSMGVGGSGHFTVTVHNYGDEGRVLHTVEKALKKAGIAPSRKTTKVKA